MGARVPWVALACLLGAAGIALAGPLARLLPHLLPACPFKALTGLPCATCGLTRCCIALSGGQWSEAFRWHPAACVILLLAPLAAAWDLQRAWRGRPYPEPPDHWLPCALAGAALVGTWVLQVLRGM